MKNRVFILKVWFYNPKYPVKAGFDKSDDELETINTFRIGKLVIGWESFESE